MKQRKQTARPARFLFAIMSLVVLLVTGCDASSPEQESQRSGVEQETKTQGTKTQGTKEKETEISGGQLEVHFIDVGQGDATLVLCDGHAMLIDAGNNDKGTLVQNYLLKHGVTELDYVIGTHPDADHIGGLDVILYKFDCGSVFLPEKENDTKTYEEVVEVLENKNYTAVCPKVGSRYMLGNASFTVIAPNRDYGDDTNDWSISILLENGSNRFLFTGDAEKPAEEDMLNNGIDLSADVLKVAHHGSSNATSEEFLTQVDPSYAVVSVGGENSYGHPHAEVLNRLRSHKVKVFRTDEQGSVVASSNGSGITWNCSPSDSWKAGEASGGETDSSVKTDASVSAEMQLQSAESVNGRYVINTNTKKFHRPSCSSVGQMSDVNKKETDKSRDELISAGYEPCKRCSP